MKSRLVFFASAATLWWKLKMLESVQLRLVCDNRRITSVFCLFLSPPVNNVGVSYPYPEYFLHIPDLDNVSVPFS